MGIQTVLFGGGYSDHCDASRRREQAPSSRAFSFGLPLAALPERSPRSSRIISTARRAKACESTGAGGALRSKDSTSSPSSCGEISPPQPILIPRLRPPTVRELERPTDRGPRQCRNLTRLTPLQLARLPASRNKCSLKWTAWAPEASSGQREEITAASRPLQPI